MPRRKTTKTPVLSKLTGPASVRYGALPKIPLPADGELQKGFNDAVATALRGSELYTRAALPVHEFRDQLVGMSPAQFISWATDYFIPFKKRFDKLGDPMEVIHDMTEQHAKNVLIDKHFLDTLPIIHRLYPSPVPIINDVGAMVVCTPGYDPSSGTYVFEGKLQPQPPDPARPPLPGLIDSSGYFDDAMTMSEAFWFLQDLLAEFPMGDRGGEPIVPQPGDPLHAYDPVTGDHRRYLPSTSLAVHIGAMLAVFASGCVPAKAPRMGFAYNANQQRSGKTLLVKIAVAAVHGAFKAQPWREEEESLNKILDAEALAGSPYICFDNVRGLIESQALESFITSPTWTGRHLGRTEMFTAENHTITFLTGNNVTVGPDIQQRVLWCELFCEDADPQSRVIDAPILDDVWLDQPANRRAILSALWAIVRHWDAAGRPLASGKPRQGFDAWCRTIGGMVEFAGFGDMLAPPKLDNTGDTEAEDITALVRVLYQRGQPDLSRDYTHQELVHLCWEEGLFHWNMQGQEEAAALREGQPHVITLKLNDKCNSRMGLLLRRHTPERGSVHMFRPDPTAAPIRLRFSSKGKGRHKRYSIHAAK